MRFNLPHIAHGFLHVSPGLPGIPRNFSVIAHKKFHITHKADFNFLNQHVNPKE